MNWRQSLLVSLGLLAGMSGLNALSSQTPVDPNRVETLPPIPKSKNEVQLLPQDRPHVLVVGLVANRLKKPTTDLAARLIPGKYDDGEQDAFRHFVGSSLLFLQVPAAARETAYRALVMREDPTTESGRMDLANNAAAFAYVERLTRELANDKISSERLLERVCQEALKRIDEFRLVVAASDARQLLAAREWLRQPAKLRAILAEFPAFHANQPTEQPGAQAPLPIESRVFGRLNSGEEIRLFTLKQANGLQASIMNWGGIIVELKVPDRAGQPGNIVLNFDNLESYQAGHPLFGALVGRYANRIANARFMLDGQTFELPRNAGKHHIHGGPNGFDKVVWNAEPLSTPAGPSLRLTHRSPDKFNGFPGNLDVTVTYTLTANELRVDYQARTDKPTIINPTNHAYFHLGQPGQGDVLGHVLQLEADQFTPVDRDLIPTGELRSVAGTALDFREPTALGARIQSDDEWIKLGRGYDHNFVIRRNGPEALVRAATVYEPQSGRVMEVWTMAPGVQLYTANGMNVKQPGPGGVKYGSRGGFCLETQYYPNSPNTPSFPSPVIRPDQDWRSTTLYRFSTRGSAEPARP